MASTVEQRLKEVAAVGQEIPETGVAYLDGRFTPLADAKISIATHALQYGTGVFEGIRAYWNPAHEQLYVFRLREHFERMARSVKIMRITLPADPVSLSETTLELLRKNGFKNDVYVRPLAFKAARSVKVALEGLRDGFGMYAFPLGAYLPTGGLAARTASWRRTSDDAIPARGKITGAYINTALAVDEAHDYEADEAIFLTADGHVSEGSAANLFLVRDGTLITAPASDNILEGIVRSSVLRIAKDEKIPVEIRRIDRTELYISDEAFFCGTGVQISPITSIDHRSVGTGEVGPIARRVSRIYFESVRGKNAKYRDWLTPIYPEKSR